MGKKMNREQRHMDRIRKKRKRHIILFIIFIAVLIATVCIGPVSYTHLPIGEEEDSHLGDFIPDDDAPDVYKRQDKLRIERRAS